MLIGTIRPLEVRKADVEGHSLDEIRAHALAQMPDGFQLTSIPVRMVKGGTALTATATYTREDGIRSIEAEDRQSLFAKVPTGWQLLSVHAF